MTIHKSLFKIYTNGKGSELGGKSSAVFVLWLYRVGKALFHAYLLDNIILKRRIMNSFAYKRKLTPDLARGYMLLFIALAHGNQFLFSTDRDITITD